MICILFGVAIRSTRSRFIPLAVMLLLWIGYLVGIGGDIFGAYRHYIPVMVILTFALIEGTTFVVQAIQREWPVPRSALWTGAAIYCGMFIIAQYQGYNAFDQIGTPSLGRRNAR